MALQIAGVFLDGDIPEGWTPYGALVILKCLDKEGKAKLCFRSNGNDWTVWEAIGALEAFASSLNEDFQESLEDTEESE